MPKPHAPRGRMGWLVDRGQEEEEVMDVATNVLKHPWFLSPLQWAGSPLGRGRARQSSRVRQVLCPHLTGSFLLSLYGLMTSV